MSLWSIYLLVPSPRKSLLIALFLWTSWFTWAAINGITWAVKDPANEADHTRYTIVNGITGFLLCGALFVAYEQLRKRLGLGLFVATVVVLCYFAGIGLDQLTAFAAPWIGWTVTYDPSLSHVLIVSGLRSGTIMGLFSLLYFATDHWLKLNSEREKVRQSDALAQQAELLMLRYQLNPHFLFNSLNSIRAMVVEDPLRAREIVTRLSEFLRHTLKANGTECTIGDEIAAVRNYLAIQNIRFEERLQVSILAGEDTKACMVPCFLIHPLVENAVKYGIETSPPPLKVTVEVSRENDWLTIRVTNTGRLLTLPENSGTGTGLSNVRRRLELAFPNRYKFELSARDGHVRAEICLRQINAP